LLRLTKRLRNTPQSVRHLSKEQEAYKQKVADFISTYLSKNASRIGYEYSDTIRISQHFGGSKVELIFDTSAIADFPKRPESPTAPNQRESFGREYVTRKELLEKNLRILKMTSQEEVNASTYGAIMEII
jgi:hypothetical protein